MGNESPVAGLRSSSVLVVVEEVRGVEDVRDGAVAGKKFGATGEKLPAAGGEDLCATGEELPGARGEDLV